MKTQSYIVAAPRYCMISAPVGSKKKWSKNEVNLNLFTDNNDNGAEKECESINLKMIEI